MYPNNRRRWADLKDEDEEQAAYRKLAVVQTLSRSVFVELVPTRKPGNKSTRERGSERERERERQ